MAFPVIKLNDKRINVFNIDFVESLVFVAPHVHSNGCLIHFSSGKQQELRGDEAAAFLKFWDENGEDISPRPPVQESTAQIHPAASRADLDLGESDA